MSEQQTAPAGSGAPRVGDEVTLSARVTGAIPDGAAAVVRVSHRGRGDGEKVLAVRRGTVRGRRVEVPWTMQGRPGYRVHELPLEFDVEAGGKRTPRARLPLQPERLIEVEIHNPSAGGYTLEVGCPLYDVKTGTARPRLASAPGERVRAEVPRAYGGRAVVRAAGRRGGSSWPCRSAIWKHEESHPCDRAVGLVARGRVERRRAHAAPPRRGLPVRRGGSVEGADAHDGRTLVRAMTDAGVRLVPEPSSEGQPPAPPNHARQLANSAPVGALLFGGLLGVVAAELYAPTPGRALAAAGAASAVALAALRNSVLRSARVASAAGLYMLAFMALSLASRREVGWETERVHNTTRALDRDRGTYAFGADRGFRYAPVAAEAHTRTQTAPASMRGRTSCWGSGHRCACASPRCSPPC